MKEQFADYETSKMLKELGFKEQTICFFEKQRNELKTCYALDVCDKSTHFILGYNQIASPLWQQVKEWLWDECAIFILIERSHVGKFNFFPFKEKIGLYLFDDDVYYDSPIEAEIKAIQETVKYLHSKLNNK